MSLRIKIFLLKVVNLRQSQCECFQQCQKPAHFFVECISRYLCLPCRGNVAHKSNCLCLHPVMSACNQIWLATSLCDDVSDWLANRGRSRKSHYKLKMTPKQQQTGKIMSVNRKQQRFTVLQVKTIQERFHVLPPSLKTLLSLLKNKTGVYLMWP